MKKRRMSVTKYILLFSLTMGNVTLFPAQESITSAAQEEQSRLQQISHWLQARYGLLQDDWDIVKKWLINKWRGEEIEPALDQHAKSIFKKYIIPAVIITALVGGLALWGGQKLRAQRAREESEQERMKRIEGEALKRGRTTLMQAVSQGDDAIVKLLLDRGEDVNAKDAFGDIPLIKASQMRQEKIAALLLKYGADVNAVNQEGYTALMLAAQNRDEPMLYLLLMYNPDVSLQNKKGETVFNIFPGIKDIIAKIKLYRAKAVVSPVTKIEDMPSPIADLPIERRIDIASYILGEDYFTKINRDLINAAQRGDINTATELLQMGANVNYVSKSGNTPLGVAAMTGEENMIKFLLDNQANIDAYSQGMTPLMRAAAKGFSAVVNLLLNRGGTVDAQSTIGKTALMYATERGDQNIVELLLGKGANPLIEDRAGKKARDLTTDSFLQTRLLLAEEVAEIAAYHKTIAEMKAKRDEDIRKRLMEERIKLEAQEAELRELERKVTEEKERLESIERAKQTLTPEQRSRLERHIKSGLTPQEKEQTEAYIAQKRKEIEEAIAQQKATQELPTGSEGKEEE